MPQVQRQLPFLTVFHCSQLVFYILNCPLKFSNFALMSLKDQIITERLPKHIAIIMDGNGRWAQERGQDRIYGHMNGVKSVREVVEGAAELGVQCLTLYAFSTENWERPEKEVAALMELMVNTIREEVDGLIKNNIKLHVIGELSMLPQQARTSLDEALKLTSSNNGLNLIVALSYSSRWEIAEAIKLIAQEVQAGKLNPEQIDQETLDCYLSTHEFPDPELMIRTSGEQRISNFLLYQLAYAELYFTKTHWPDFRKEHLYEAIVEYQKRDRRFGKVKV